MTAEKIVITGVGALTPLGNDSRSSFDGIVAGKSGVGRVSFVLHPDSSVRIAGEVKGFDPVALFGRRVSRRYARFTNFALAAAREAVSDSGFVDAGYDPESVATIVGVGFGGIDFVHRSMERMERRGPRGLTPFDLPGVIPNMAAAVISMEINARGPCFTINSACSSSTHAIGEALELLRRGGANAVIAGGTAGDINALTLAGFARLGALSTRNHEPERASRPFDSNRDGFVMGEGAGILVLERLSAARKRGARVYAELAGYGTTSDAYHMLIPVEDGEGAARAIRAALDSAKANASDVDYINAHGTSTRDNDIAETLAIKKAFGEHANALWVSSNKSMMGHLMGAAGAVETIFTAMSIYYEVVPPTLNLEDPGEGCDLDYVAGSARARRLNLALNNNFGFGGHNVILALRRVD